MTHVTQAAMYGAQAAQQGASVGKALGGNSLGGKAIAMYTVAAAGMTGGAAQAAIAVPTELLDVFTDLATAFGTLVAAGAILFGVIRGTLALFKLARSVFGAAGA